MTHREFLLEAILDYPDDDLPRLAYADVCEEEGDLEVANMIRVSLEYAETFDCLDRDGYCFMDVVLGSCELCKRRDILHESLEGLFAPAVTDHFAYGLTEEIRRSHLLSLVKSTINFSTVVFWRGFVREIALTQDLFLQHAKTLFNSHPIERVRLIDRVPAEWVRASGQSAPVSFSWHCDHQLVDTPSLLLMPIWSCLDYLESGDVFKLYPSRKEANQALEVAALAYGKSLRKSKRHQEGSHHASL